MGTRKSSQAQGADGHAGRRAMTTVRGAEPAALAAQPERATSPRARRVLVAAHAVAAHAVAAHAVAAHAVAAPATPAHAHPRHGAVPPPPIALFPARPAPATPATHQPRRQRFGDLREALADGWEIVQPIFARPLWSAPDDSKTAFNFVLAGPHGMRLVTVPEGRTVERFIRTRQLTVDYAR